MYVRHHTVLRPTPTSPADPLFETPIKTPAHERQPCPTLRHTGGSTVSTGAIQTDTPAYNHMLIAAVLDGFEYSC